MHPSFDCYTSAPRLMRSTLETSCTNSLCYLGSHLTLGPFSSTVFQESIFRPIFPSTSSISYFMQVQSQLSGKIWVVFAAKIKVIFFSDEKFPFTDKLIFEPISKCLLTMRRPKSCRGAESSMSSSMSALEDGPC